MDGLGVARWWDDPHYQQSHSLHERGAFIFSKLMQHDPRTFTHLVW